ncbi:helix-turn-helix domain-containing protein [Secundilactobacillus silagei]|uniref:helix-turn-helix domain-containing protein n=1 Tax=Secundilactobacillus silagei TaxID=1293415 RepID=UPI0006D0931A|nr:helix-turn-helix transcriptional regulator [Secundilactobacillus silagei]
MNTHNRIKELRKKNKLTLDQMSELVGIKRGTLNNYENEKTEPKLKTWENLATFFKVPITYIQGLSNDEEGWKEWEKNTGLTQKQIKKRD